MDDLLGQLEGLLFGPPDPQRPLWMRRTDVALAALMFLAGAAFWVVFLHGGGFRFQAADWPVWHRTYSVMQEAFRAGELPLYCGPEMAPRSASPPDNPYFLAYPWVPLLPYTLMLLILDIGHYLVAKALLFYGAGFAGCLLIRRRYRLSLVLFALMVLLVLFSGAVIARLAVGHTKLAFGSLLLPYLVYLVLDIEAQGLSRRRELLLALFFAVLLFQGAFHLFMTGLLFTAIVVLCNVNRRDLIAYGRLLALVALMGTLRLLPTVLFWGSTTRSFIPGYPSAIELLQWLSALRMPTAIQPDGIWVPYAMGWEYNVFIGTTGLLFLVAGGIVLRFVSENDTIPRFRRLDWPLAIMTLLSIGPAYYVVYRLGIPFLSTVERLPARFIVFPLTTLAIIACIRIQRYIDARPGHRLVRVLILFGVIHEAFLLSLHASIWRVVNIERHFPNPQAVLDAYPQPGSAVGYEASVAAGLLLTCVGFGVWAWCFQRARAQRG